MTKVIGKTSHRRSRRSQRKKKKSTSCTPLQLRNTLGALVNVTIDNSGTPVAQRYALAKATFAEGNYEAAAMMSADLSEHVIDSCRVFNSDFTKRPRYAIIILSHVQNKEVEQLIDVIQPFESDPLYEIIIVNTGNVRLLGFLLGKLRRYKYVDPGFNVGCSLGRNLGAHFSMSKYVIFLDDDGIIASHAVGSLVSTVEEYDAVAVRGRVLPKTPWGEVGPHYDRGNVCIPCAPTTEGISIWRRREFSDFGGFDLLLAGHEGLFLCSRMLPFFGPEAFIYTPRAILYHDYSTSESLSQAKKEAYKKNEAYIAWRQLDHNVTLRAFARYLKDDAVVSKFAATPRFELLKGPDPGAPVSVLIVTLNGAAYVDEFCRSLRMQTHQNFEVILVDDGSIDGTATFVRNQWAGDARVRIIETVSIGRPAALNLAVETASNDICIIAELKDVSVANRLKWTAQYFERHPQSSCVSFESFADDSHHRRDGGRLFGVESLKARSFFGMPARFPAFAFRRSEFSQSFDVSLTMGEDCDWLHRNFLAGAGDGHFVPVIGTYHRILREEAATCSRDTQANVVIASTIRTHEAVVGLLDDNERKCVAVMTGWRRVERSTSAHLRRYVFRLLEAVAREPELSRDLSILIQMFVSEMEIRTAQEQRKDAEAMAGEKTAKAAEIAALQNYESNSMIEQRDWLRSELKGARQAIADAYGEMREKSNEYASELTTLELKLRSANELNDQVQQQLIQVEEASSARISTLERELEDRERRIRASEDERAALGERLAAAEHAKLRTDELSTKLEASEAKSKALDERLAEADERIRASEDERAALGERLAAAEHAKLRTDELSTKLEASEAKGRALNDRLIEANNQRSTLEGESSEAIQVLLRQLAKHEVEIAAAVQTIERLERTKRHLSYRLGQALLEGTRSAGGLVRLPFLLVSANRAYRRDKASPPALQGEGEAAILAPGQFLVGPDPKAFSASATEGGHIAISGRAIGWGTEAEAVLKVALRYLDGNGSIVPLAGQRSASADDVDVREIAAKPLQRFQLQFPCPPNTAQIEAAFSSASAERILVCIDDMVVSKRGTAGGKPHKKPHKKPSSGPQEKPANKPRSKRARQLDDKLWGGFSRYALEDLEKLKRSRRAAAHEVSYAAWALARWHAAHQDHARALENVVAMRLTEPTAEADMGQVLLEASCLTRLGDREGARRILARTLERQPDHPDLCLAMAGTYAPLDGPGDAEAERARLSWFNRPLEKAGLLPLVKADPDRPLAIDNLATPVTDAAAPLQNQPKVSVIMPVYQARDTLPFALHGLLAQTWRNLEIVVVDDCSPDNTVALAEEFARRDPRIRVVCQDRNKGAYPARNRGLEVATGDLFTVHDSDDWSHPQKIECQLRLMAENPDCKASMSQWIRVGPHLEVVGPWVAKNSLFDLNFSSLMFRREVVNEIGGWDEVRVNGDAEFRSRLLTAYGEDAICTVQTPAFLSLSLTRPDSLTQSGPTNIRTLKYGLRGQYRDCYNHWHRKGQGDPGKLRMVKTSRPYVVPRGVTIDAEFKDRYDLVVVCDYGLYGGAFGSTLHYILAAREAGMSVAVYHWRKYDRQPVYNLNPRLYDACSEHGVDILTVGDSVAADTVLIGYPAILDHLPDALPEVRTNHVLVIVNQYAARMIEGSDPQYDPVVARAHLKQVFGQEGLWIPISNWVRRLMSEDARYPAPYPEPWHPMIRTEDWFHQPIRWNGRRRERPVVGRHGRDAYTKWPATPEALSLAYGVGQPWDMHFLGGAAHAVQMLGFTPDNWTVVEFDGITVAQFLDDLDFFVHYPHEAYIEEFGRAVLEAMAAGKPVILPMQFKETFGDAALYAEPADLAEVINRLWANEAVYLAHAQAGRNFAKEFSDLSSFPDRLTRIHAYLDNGMLATASAI